MSYLLRVASLAWPTQPVWEGLAEHRWTDTQLQELQARFLASDFLGDLDQTLKSDRAYAVLWCDQIKKQGLGVALFGASSTAPSSTPKGLYTWLGRLMPTRGSSSGGGSIVNPSPRAVFNLIGRLMPAGWYDLERMNYCRQFEDQLKGVVDFPATRVSPHNGPSDAVKLMDQLGGSPLAATLHHKLMATTVSLRTLPAKAAIAQTCANQIALACALERYRLANGQFPESLDALTPRFILHEPNDVITGQPYKYRRTADGQFVLYSVGWNEKDDGGMPGKTLFDQTQGDWVWEYPAQ